MSRITLVVTLLLVSGDFAAGRIAAGEAEPPAAEPIALGPRVAEAVKHGLLHLEAQFPNLVQRYGEEDYPMGRLALPLAALLRSGLEPASPLVNDAFAFLDKQPLEETYSVACYLMALDALVLAHARAGGPGSGRVAREQDGSPQAVGPVLARMEAGVRWLVGVRDVGNGTWSYRARKQGRKRGGPEDDNSNTQFAVLGLEIGMRHRIAVPREVFQEIVDHFSTSMLVEPKPVEFVIDFNPGKRSFLSRTRAAPRRFAQPVGGWAYTRRERHATLNMTAAGASSLMVARNGLGGLPPSSEAKLESSLGWLARRLREFILPSGTMGYGLYSLEKVGDLGDILTFNGVDWYQLGAEELLRVQDRHGGWGTPIETTLALLFLTRATRPARAQAAPRVSTSGGGDEATSDLVYLDTIDGHVSAREFLVYLEATRDRDLLKPAALIVKNYPMRRQGDLVAWLLPLFGERDDAFKAFARSTLEEITGETYRKRAEWQRWSEGWLAVRALELARSADGAKAAELLPTLAGERLKMRLMEWIAKEGLAECVPAVIGEFSTGSEAKHMRTNDVLRRLVGQSVADAEAEAPQALAERWSALWAAEGERILFGRRVREVAAKLDLLKRGLVDHVEADRLVGELERLGKNAVPLILDAMEAEEHSAWLVVALERITGEHRGFRAAPWREKRTP